MAFLDDMKSYVATAGVIASGSIYRHLEPDSPDRIVALIPVPGPPPDETLCGPIADRLQLQVRCRDVNGDAAYALAVAAYNAFAAFVRQTIAGTRYISARLLNSVGLLDRESQGPGEAGRLVYGFTVELEVGR